MPKITKQSTNDVEPLPSSVHSTPSPSTLEPQGKQYGILARAQPLTQRRKGAKLLVYGESKVGKTRISVTFPKPMLLVGFEDGTDSVVGTPGVKFILIESIAEYQEIIQSMPDSGYKSIALDTVTGLQDIVFKEFLNLSKTPSHKTWGDADQQQWGIIGGQVKDHLRDLFDLADKHLINVVVTAQQRDFPPPKGAESIGVPRIGPAVQPMVMIYLNATVEYITQAYKQQRIIKEKVDAGDGTFEEVERYTNDMDYLLRLEDHPLYATGFRRRPDLPPLRGSLVNPTFDALISIIRGETPATKLLATNKPTAPKK